MFYTDFKGIKLPSLGLGCMRLPTIDGKNGDVNKTAAREIVDYAMKNGVNYFDTAWGYHEGNSERVMGEILSDYPRESFMLASKFPGAMDRVEEIFETQLEKCKVDYFDFYLFHNVSEGNIDAYLTEPYVAFTYLKKQKEKGRIRHLGFSAHGNLNTLKRFLEKFGNDLEFCQLQINYVDWDFQNAKEKVELVSSYGIPVWVMEPIRGGGLANLKPEYAERLKAMNPGMTNAEWAFRYIQSIPEVKLTLSGMSNMEQIKQNIKTFEEMKPLTEAEIMVLYEIGKDMTASNAMRCTSCRYCTPKCPKELDIPKLISLCSERLNGRNSEELKEIPNDKLPSACISCRSCEKACPQSIKISEIMKAFAEKM